MRLVRPLRAGRLLERLPRPTVSTGLELLLLALLAVQCARLTWVLVTPTGPVGDWRAPGAFRLPPSLSPVAGAFDPFFRLSAPAGPAVVTSLDLTLFGVREDRATGRGSAILGLPGGEQGSFAVGDEILPGVTLTAVDFDSVTISRNGAAEQIFLDQSTPAAVTGQGEGAVPPQPQVAAPPAQSLSRQIQFQPRLSDGRVTGIAVQPAGTGEAFRAAGFAPGDVIVSVNGQRITSADQARGLVEQSRGEVNVVVDRAGAAVPLKVRLNP